MIDVQCYPLEKQLDRIRKPFHEVALASLEEGAHPYQLSQTLGSLAAFWERYSAGDAELRDFQEDFDGKKRRAKKLARKRGQRV